MMLTGFAVVTIASFVFAGDLPNPSADDVAHELAYALATGIVNLFLAVGLAAIVSSRIVIGVLIVWNSVVAHILISFHSLGSARKFIDVAAAEHFQPHQSSDQRVAMSTAAALVILVVWAAVFARAGRFWTRAPRRLTACATPPTVGPHPRVSSRRADQLERFSFVTLGLTTLVRRDAYRKSRRSWLLSAEPLLPAMSCGRTAVAHSSHLV